MFSQASAVQGGGDEQHKKHHGIGHMVGYPSTSDLVTPPRERLGRVPPSPWTSDLGLPC